jgi:Ca-activated chloride channel family protein
MNFTNLYAWLLIWLLPLVAAVLIIAHLARWQSARQFLDTVMCTRLAPRAGFALPILKMLLVLIGLFLVVFAMTGPRFGVYFTEVSRRGADLVILLDVSKSMTAEDVGQSRLARAKSDIRDLLSRLGGDRVGLVVFAGQAVTKAPLTSDHGFFLSMLAEIDTDSAPRGGSLIGDGIRKCLEILDPQADRDQVIVLITDGEDHESFPLEAARSAAERGVKLLAVGLGDSQEGARIPVAQASGERKFLQHEGQVIWSKLDGDLLEKIALETGGAYIPAGTRAYDLGQFYEQHLAGLSRSEYQQEKRRLLKEQFQWPLAFGVFLLMIEILIPTYLRPRPIVGKENTNHA